MLPFVLMVVIVQSSSASPNCNTDHSQKVLKDFFYFFFLLSRTGRPGPVLQLGDADDAAHTRITRIKT